MEALMTIAGTDGRIDPRRGGSHTPSIPVYLQQQLKTGTPRTWNEVLHALCEEGLVRRVGEHYVVVSILESAPLTPEQKLEKNVANLNSKLKELEEQQMGAVLKRIQAVAVESAVETAKLKTYKELKAQLARLESELAQMP